MRSIFPLLAILLAGCAAANTSSTEAARDARELDQALAGRVAGKPIDCIDNQTASSTTQIVGHTILYSETNRVIWRADVAQCPALDRDALIVIHRFGSQLCRLDRFDVVDRTTRFPRSSCQFESFTPYTKR